MKYLVLGCGMQGRVAAQELARAGHQVVIVDNNESNLGHAARMKGLATRRFDVTQTGSLVKLMRGFDVVVGALPAALGYHSMACAVRAGRDMADMSYSSDDPFRLDRPARRAGVRIVPDAGFAPGLSNILIGAAWRTMGRFDEVRILVGGLPQHPLPPFNYRITWSPADLLEEYTRPARYVAGGRVRTAPALTDIEEFTFPGIGRLECFLTDGLRTLIRTLRGTPSMVEKTIRYPGHARLFRQFIDCGLLANFPLAKGQPSPRAFMLEFLKHALSQGDERDLSLLIVEVRRGRVSKRFTCVDHYDPRQRVTSMARMTAYSGAIIARCFQQYPETGVIAPEMLGTQPAIYRFIMKELRSRGIVVRESR